MKEFIDVSRSSPKSNNRACYCKDTNTYSKKCCDGTLFAQGIGSITLAPLPPFATTQWQDINTQWQNTNTTWND